MAPDAALLTFLDVPPSAATALASLGGPVRRWFVERFGSPTMAQRFAWPVLAAGKSLLLAAPTGNGKTLAAFAPILEALLAGSTGDGIRCLYVAPLKALVADAGRNLRDCLEQLPASQLRIGLRTGDTTATTRRRLRFEPPDILLTTPESLAVLLSHAHAGELFRKVRWLVVDEIHALAANKRGADLALSLERLAALTPDEPQRIGLSATCAPLDVTAGFLAGTGRSCTIAEVRDTAPLNLTVEPLEAGEPRSFLPRLLDRLAPELAANRTTLIFTNVRSLAERLVWTLRRRFPDWADAVAVHHSAVSRARRRRAEQQLKAGRLRAVVSSTSLELGIDIGSVDLVVLVHPPGGVVRLLQRVGRAGHAPGQPRRGLVLTATPGELLEATVTTAAGRAGQCEPLRVPPPPLDVLCQQLLGLAAQRPWLVEEAFSLVRRAYPFRELHPGDFGDCLDYLSGRRRDGQLWLPSRLRWNGDEFRVADMQTTKLLRRNIGTIVAEETRPVCLNPQESNNDVPIRVGDVDEAFADRLQPGDRFRRDGRCLEFRRSEGRALVVDETPGRPATPRWSGNGWPLSSALAQRLYLLRSQAAEALRDGPAALARLLRGDYGLGDAATATLVTLFQRQECVSEVPDATMCLVEVVDGPSGLDYYVHTPLNRAANDAVARVVVRRLVRECGRTALSMVADLGFLLAVDGWELTPADFGQLLHADGFDADLAAAVADSVTLRERFRCVALTGLMLLRHPLGRRRRVGGHDWAERRLFEQVRAADPEFVLLRQAQREVHAEVLDAAAARAYLAEMPRRTLRWRRLPAPSPLAEGWTQAITGAVETAESPEEALQRLHAALMAEGA